MTKNKKGYGECMETWHIRDVTKLLGTYNLIRNMDKLNLLLYKYVSNQKQTQASSQLLKANYDHKNVSMALQYAVLVPYVPHLHDLHFSNHSYQFIQSSSEVAKQHWADQVPLTQAWLLVGQTWCFQTKIEMAKVRGQWALRGLQPLLPEYTLT